MIVWQVLFFALPAIGLPLYGAGESLPLLHRLRPAYLMAGWSLLLSPIWLNLLFVLLHL